MNTPNAHKVIAHRIVLSDSGQWVVSIKTAGWGWDYAGAHRSKAAAERQVAAYVRTGNE